MAELILTFNYVIRREILRFFILIRVKFSVTRIDFELFELSEKSSKISWFLGPQKFNTSQKLPQTHLTLIWDA